MSERPLHLVQAIVTAHIFGGKHQHADVRRVLYGVHLPDNGFARREALMVDQHLRAASAQTRRETIDDPLSLSVAVADEDFLPHSYPPSCAKSREFLPSSSFVRQGFAVCMSMRRITDPLAG